MGKGARPRTRTLALSARPCSTSRSSTLLFFTFFFFPPAAPSGFAILRDDEANFLAAPRGSRCRRSPSTQITRLLRLPFRLPSSADTARNGGAMVRAGSTHTLRSMPPRCAGITKAENSGWAASSGRTWATRVPSKIATALIVAPAPRASLLAEQR
jgi:hypothetical protein